MLERFEISEIFEPGTAVEHLDKGIYLEHITGSHNVVPDIETMKMVFGEIKPDTRWWQSIMDGAVEKGFIDDDGSVPWHTLGQYFSVHGLASDYMDGTSLETLTEMLAQGEKVICALNDFVLEVPQAASLPSVFPNQFVLVTGLDLSEPGRETVVVVKPVRGGQGEKAEQLPLENFLKAWMVGNSRAMAVYVEE